MQHWTNKQLNQVQVLTPYFFKVHLINILQSMATLPQVIYPVCNTISYTYVYQ
jgi:hypothetical protein